MISQKLKNDLLAASGEFFGTFMFLFFGLGGIQASASSSAGNDRGSIPDPTQLFYIATSMGFSLIVSVWIFYRVSGSNFNPQVSLALLLCGILKPIRFLLYVIAQMAGAIAACGILTAVLPGPLVVTPSLGDNTSKTQGLFLEMFLTAGLCLAVLMLAVEKQKTTAIAPVGIGLTLFVGHLAGVLFTGAGLNSARVFAASIITGFPNEHWIYWVGPSMGSVLAAALYTFLKAVDYTKLNVGQDSLDEDESPKVPAAVWLRSIFVPGDADGGVPQRPSLADSLRYQSDAGESHEPKQTV